MTGRTVRRVTVEAPARLHLGFLDPHGGLGRRFAGLGLAIDAFFTVLEVEPAPATHIEGPERERLAVLLDRFSSVWQLPPIAVRCLHAIPSHAGLGSGTQLALALGTALARLVDRPVSAVELARIAGRGQRSGIGLGAFERGGFVLDGGRAEGEELPPPVVSRLAFPDRWRLLLVLDRDGAGLSGEEERRAFAELPPFPEAQAAHLCRLALMRVLPGIARADHAAVASGIGEIQRIVGGWFAPLQAAGIYASPAVAGVMAWLAGQGFAGVGQSSWGPTGFALVPDAAVAANLLEQVRRRFGHASALRFKLAAARNRGARVRVA